MFDATNTGFEIYCEPKRCSNVIEVHLRNWPGDGTMLVGQPVNMERIQDPDSYYPTPAFNLNRKSAQMLIDELWNCGLRPSEGTGSAGQLAATQRHLEDMRALAFHKLNVQQPPKGEKK